MLSKKAKKDNILVKLFQILKDNEYNEIISWNNDGEIIIIYNTSTFSSVILPKISNHSNYESFVRILNMYGFTKIPKINSEHDQFFHQDFRKDKEKEEIRNIKRKSTSDNNTENENDEINDYINLIQSGNINLLSDIYILDYIIKKTKENSNFYNTINQKLSEIKNKNIDLLNKIQAFNNSIGINNNNDMKDNKIFNDSIGNDNNIINNNYDNNTMNNNIDYTLNLSQSLNPINIFQNEYIKIDNENDNYPGIFDNQKNIFDS